MQSCTAALWRIYVSCRAVVKKCNCTICIAVRRSEFAAVRHSCQCISRGPEPYSLEWRMFSIWLRGPTHALMRCNKAMKISPVSRATITVDNSSLTSAYTLTKILLRLFKSGLLVQCACVERQTRVIHIDFKFLKQILRFETFPEWNLDSKCCACN